MTYVTGQLIQTTDVSALVGDTNNTQAYASEAACSDKLAAIYGVGYGTYGYGQSPFILAVPTVGTVVTSNNWTNIYYAIASIASHTNTDLSSYGIQGIVNPPTQNYLAPGVTIATSDSQFTDPGPGTLYNWAGAIAALDTNKDNANASYMKTDADPSLTSSRLEDRPFDSWVYHKFTVTFGSEDNARYFFNSGSQIRLTAYVNGDDGTAPSQAWASYLTTLSSNLGYIAMGATSTSQVDGDNTGIVSLIGYYDLTSSFQTIFTLTFATAYSIVVEAKTGSGPFVNGSNGASLDFIFKFNANSNDVAVNLYSEIYNYRPFIPSDYTISLAYPPVTVASPTYVTTENLNFADTPTPTPSPPGPAYWQFSQDLTGRNFNYNIWDQIQQAGYQSSYGTIIANVTLKSGAQLLSSATNFPSFIVPNEMPSDALVTFVVEYGAVVAGRGGQGGTGAPSGICGCVEGGAGSAGGPAIWLLQAKTKILNYGVIGGGGGGGGGGGSECQRKYPSSAGGGGGGAGIDSNNGGAVETCGAGDGLDGKPGSPGDTNFVDGGPGGAAGSIYTAAGGAGGNLGQWGNPGGNGGAPYSEYVYDSENGNWSTVIVEGFGAIGGTGGAPGSSIVYVTGCLDLDGSQLNDTRGPITVT